MLNDACSSHFNQTAEDVLDKENVDRIIFCDFLYDRMAERPPYIQVLDMKFLIEKVDEYLEEYNNEMGAKKAMRLVMFLDACEHICRIGRVLRQPMGHC